MFVCLCWQRDGVFSTRRLASERLCTGMTLLCSVEVETKMKEWYSVKVRRIMGPDPGDCKKITMLGRELV